jgi:hypothetical protein
MLSLEVRRDLRSRKGIGKGIRNSKGLILVEQLVLSSRLLQ